LAIDPRAKDTASASRDHVIEVSDSGLVTIAGGKWTTYRRMAKDTVDKALEISNLFPGTKKPKCNTEKIKMIGAENWELAFFTVIAQDYKRMKTVKSKHNNWEPSLVRIPQDMAKHLSRSYGTRSMRVAEIAQNGYGNRLAEGFPYLEAEVVYAAQEEYACTVVDVLARRLRLAFLDAEVARACIPQVVELMGKTLKWDDAKKKQEMDAAVYFMHIMTVGRVDEYNDDQDH